MKKRTGISEPVALHLRSVYMRLWVARCRDEAYPTNCIDGATLDAMLAHHHVIRSSPYHVSMTDDGAACYALACEDILMSAVRTYENTDKLRDLLMAIKESAE